MRQWCWVCVCLCVGVATTASAQTDPSHGPDAMQEPASQAQSGPTLALHGFTDINFSGTDNPNSGDGFSVGQFVLHLSSSLGEKVSFFGETSFTAQATTYSVAVERTILRYDYNDHLKVSVGKYHTPINYWNTAFHHGLWLQTTISRPEMIQVGGALQPVHFVGVLAEGTLPGAPAAGLGYNVGFGNGRGTTLASAADSGAVSGKRAWLAKLYARPISLYGLELGTAIYRDRIATPTATEANELIASAYVAWTRGAPELISEYANVHHHDRTTSQDFDTHAFYVQGAYRFPEQPRVKPYARFEKISAAKDPYLPTIAQTIWTIGTRYELSQFACAKVEYRHHERPDRAAINGVFAQAAFTF